MNLKQVISLATVMLFSSFIIIACGGGSNKKDKSGQSQAAAPSGGADLEKKVLVIGEGGELSIFDPKNPYSGRRSRCCGPVRRNQPQQDLEPKFIVVPSWNQSNKSPNCCGGRRY